MKKLNIVILFCLFSNFLLAAEVKDSFVPWYKQSEKLKQKQVNESFRLLDQHGYAHSLLDFSDKKAVIFTPFIQQCPTNKFFYKLLNFLESDLKVVGVNSDATISREDVVKQIGNAGTTVLFDYIQLLAREYGFSKSGDFKKINFNSNIENKNKMASVKINIMDELLSREENSFFLKSKALLAKSGIALLLAISDRLEACRVKIDTSKVVFDEGLTKNLYKSCIVCHRSRKSINMFQTIADFKKWREMNLQTIKTMRMPPNGYDYFGKTHLYYPVFDRYEYPTAQELKQIYSWLEQGAESPNFSKKNDPLELLWQKEAIKDKSENNEFAKYKKINLKMKKTEIIPAEGKAIWKSYELMGPTKEDLFVTGFKVKSNLDVAHHVNIMYITKPLSQWRRNKMDYSEGLKQLMDENHEYVLSTISKRNGVDLLPENMHHFIPKGSYIVLQIHYSPNGRAEKNQSTLEIFYNPKAPETQSKEVFRFYNKPDRKFVLMPNERNIKFISSFDVDEDIEVIRARLHGHFRHVGHRVYIKYPDGKEDLVINVPFYQFKNHPGSLLLKSIFVPKGSKIVGDFLYDNSKYNLANPDPNKKIKFGGSTYNSEMAIFRVHYHKR